MTLKTKSNVHKCQNKIKLDVDNHQVRITQWQPNVNVMLNLILIFIYQTWFVI